MALQIDSLQVDIKTSARTAVPAIEQLAESLKKLRKATDKALGLGRMANQIKNFAEVLQKTNFATIASNVDALGRELSKVSAKIAGINGKKLYALNGVIKTLATSANNLSTKALMKKALTEINLEAETCAASVKKLNKESKGLKLGAFGTVLTKGGGGLLQSVGRIAFYRAIRSALKAVTTALKEGTSNLYQFGKAFNSSFVQSLDSVSTSVQYLKNGLAVGLAPLIQALTPIVVSCADAIADLGNAISEAYANKNGDEYFTKAVKSFKEYQEAAEKAKNTTLGFDELNVIENKNPISDMFEQVAVDSERAEQNLEKIQTTLSSIIGIGGGILTGKVLSFLNNAGVTEMSGGQIMLKMSVVGLVISGVIDIYQSIADAIESGELDSGGRLQLAKGITESGGALSLMLGNPIPIVVSLIVSFVILSQDITDFFDESLDTIQNTEYEFPFNISAAIGSLLAVIIGGVAGTVEGFFNGPFNGDWQTDFLPSLMTMLTNLFAIFTSNILYGFANIGIFLINKIANLFGHQGDLIPYFEFEKFLTMEEGRVMFNSNGWNEALDPHVTAVTPKGNFIVDRNGTAVRSSDLDGPVIDFGTVDQFSTSDGSSASGVPSSNGGIFNSYEDYKKYQDQIQIYLDGKQIYGAVKKAEVTSGQRIARAGVYVEG